MNEWAWGLLPKVVTLPFTCLGPWRHVYLYPWPTHLPLLTCTASPSPPPYSGFTRWPSYTGHWALECTVPSASTLFLHHSAWLTPAHSALSAHAILDPSACVHSPRHRTWRTTALSLKTSKLIATWGNFFDLVRHKMLFICLQRRMPSPSTLTLSPGCRYCPAVPSRLLWVSQPWKPVLQGQARSNLGSLITRLVLCLQRTCITLHHIPSVSILRGRRGGGLLYPGHPMHPQHRTRADTLCLQSASKKLCDQGSLLGTGAQRGGVAPGKCNPSRAERILGWQSWRAVSPVCTNLRSGHWDPERANGAPKATPCVSLKGIVRTCKFHYILWAWAPGAGRSGILGSVSTSYGTKA